jgi:hypothetical protein
MTFAQLTLPAEYHLAVDEEDIFSHDGLQEEPSKFGRPIALNMEEVDTIPYPSLHEDSRRLLLNVVIANTDLHDNSCDSEITIRQYSEQIPWNLPQTGDNLPPKAITPFEINTSSFFPPDSDPDHVMHSRKAALPDALPFASVNLPDMERIGVNRMMIMQHRMGTDFTSQPPSVSHSGQPLQIVHTPAKKLGHRASTKFSATGSILNNIAGDQHNVTINNLTLCSSPSPLSAAGLIPLACRSHTATGEALYCSGDVHISICI